MKRFPTSFVTSTRGLPVRTSLSRTNDRFPSVSFGSEIGTTVYLVLYQLALRADIGTILVWDCPIRNLDDFNARNSIELAFMRLIISPHQAEVLLHIVLLD